MAQQNDSNQRGSKETLAGEGAGNQQGGMRGKQGGAAENQNQSGQGSWAGGQGGASGQSGREGGRGSHESGQSGQQDGGLAGHRKSDATDSGSAQKGKKSGNL